MARTSKPTKSTTNNIDVSFGAFERGNFRVPYMSAILNIKEIKDWIQLVVEDSNYVDQDWSVEELYQRDLDQRRVVQIARHYLGDKQNNRPAFFNSITVVLMQKDKPQGGYVAPDAVSDPNYPNTTPIGPIRICFERNSPGGSYPDDCSFGTLSWNLQQVRAVAIDGQHRLAAIKNFHENDASEAEKSSVSVLFLVVDKKIGFLAPSYTKDEQIKYMRSIFIDLNKHAVPVSRSRNILLDDRDPQALMLKSLISPNLSYKSTSKKNRWGLKKGRDSEFDSNIPLSLVDWHGETRSKIDNGPYLSSILSLDWVVTKALKTYNFPPQKVLEFGHLSVDDEGYYKSVANILRDWKTVWKICEGDLDTAKKANSEFFFSEQALSATQQEFCKLWGYSIVRLFTALSPYRELIKVRLKNKTLTAQFSQWYQAVDVYEANKKQEDQVTIHYRDKLQRVERTLRDSKFDIDKFQATLKECEDVKAKYEIPYFLVGQRSLVLALTKLVSTNDSVEWAKLTGKSLTKYKYSPNDFFAEFMVESLNSIEHKLHSKNKSIYKKDLIIHNGAGDLGDLSKNLWAGSLVKRDNTEEIDFSDSAANRGSKVLLLLIFLHWFRHKNPTIKVASVVGAVADPESISTREFAKELNIAIRDARGYIDKKDSYSNPFLHHVRRLEDKATQKHLDAFTGAVIKWFYRNC